MANIAVFKKETGELVNLIVADLSDECPDDCRFEIIPDGHFWDGTKFVSINKTVTPMSL
jgi:hypothetical protein